MPVLTQFVLAAVTLFAAIDLASAACRSENFEDGDYIVCSFDLAETDLRFFWQHPDGDAFGTFTALAGHLEGNDAKLAFAMNGGMYGEDYSPIGLYIEDGKELAPANTRSVAADVKPVPNFYKKPNGIFYVGKGTAGVMTTEAFLAAKPEARFATQSGPMLVIDGAVNPLFIPGSSDLNPRNGVCAPTPTTVDFVITEGTRQLPRLRPLLPRPPQVQGRPVPRRRLGVGALRAGTRPERRAGPWRLRADHRGGGEGAGHLREVAPSAGRPASPPP